MSKAAPASRSNASAPPALQQQGFYASLCPKCIDAPETEDSILQRPIVLLAFLTAFPAIADPVFEVHTGHWTILATEGSCMAQNRPQSELGTLPINTLFVIAKPEGDISLVMAFWPGALSNKDAALTLRIAGHDRFDLPAQVLLDPWIMLRTTDPLPDALLQILAGQEEMPLYNVIIEPDVSDTETFIDIEDMPRVMGELQRCLTVLQP
jgi:hypothetical protein